MAHLRAIPASRSRTVLATEVPATAARTTARADRTVRRVTAPVATVPPGADPTTGRTAPPGEGPATGRRRRRVRRRRDAGGRPDDDRGPDARSADVAPGARRRAAHRARRSSLAGRVRCCQLPRCRADVLAPRRPSSPGTSQRAACGAVNAQAVVGARFRPDGSQRTPPPPPPTTTTPTGDGSAPKRCLELFRQPAGASPTSSSAPRDG